MVISIPAAIGLFLVLKDALKSINGNIVCLTTHTQAFLKDFQWIVEDVGTRPIEIYEIMSDAFPSTWGACNASEQGIGGVHFIPLSDSCALPMLWRSCWTRNIIDSLVSSSNPNSTITNSDLELAGIIAQFDVLAQAIDILFHTIHIFLTILPLRHGSLRAQPPYLDPLHIYYAYMLYTNDIIGISLSMTSSWV
jgi:hypothetical protein